MDTAFRVKNPTIYQILLDPKLAEENSKLGGFDSYIPTVTEKRKQIYGEATMVQVRREAIVGLVANISIAAIAIFAAVWISRVMNYPQWSKQAAQALAGNDTPLFGKVPTDLILSGSVYKWIEAPPLSRGVSKWEQIQAPSEFFIFSQNVEAKMNSVTFRTLSVSLFGGCACLPLCLFRLKTWGMKKFSSIQTKLNEHIAHVRNQILEGVLKDDEILQLHKRPFKYDQMSPGVVQRMMLFGWKHGFDATLALIFDNKNLLRGTNEDIAISDQLYDHNELGGRKATKMECFKAVHSRMLYDKYAGFMASSAVEPGADSPNRPAYEEYKKVEAILKQIEPIYEEMLAIRVKHSRQEADARQLKIMNEIERLIAKTEGRNKDRYNGLDLFAEGDSEEKVKTALEGTKEDKDQINKLAGQLNFEKN